MPSHFKSTVWEHKAIQWFVPLYRLAVLCNFEKKRLHSIIQCSDRAVFFWTDLLCCLFLSFHAFFFSLREQYGRISSLTSLSQGAQVREHCSRKHDKWLLECLLFYFPGTWYVEKLTKNPCHHHTLSVPIVYPVLHIA